MEIVDEGTGTGQIMSIESCGCLHCPIGCDSLIGNERESPQLGTILFAPTFEEHGAILGKDSESRSIVIGGSPEELPQGSSPKLFCHCDLAELLENGVELGGAPCLRSSRANSSAGRELPQLSDFAQFRHHRYQHPPPSLHQFQHSSFNKLTSFTTQHAYTV